MFTGRMRSIVSLVCLACLLNLNCGQQLPESTLLPVGDDEQASRIEFASVLQILQAKLPITLNTSSAGPGIGRPVSMEVIMAGPSGAVDANVVIDANDPLDGKWYYKIADPYGPAVPWPAVPTSAYFSVQLIPDPNADPNMEDFADEATIHFYLRAASSDDPNVKGATPLLTLDEYQSPTTFAVLNLKFEAGGTPIMVEGFMADSNEAAGAYMMNYLGGQTSASYYHMLPGVVPFSDPALGDTRQVPQDLFVDSQPGEYQFVYMPDFLNVSCILGWTQMPGSLPAAGFFPIHYNWTNAPGTVPSGEVFELGVGACLKVIDIPPQQE